MISRIHRRDTDFFRINENTPSIYLLPMCWRWRCRARFRCSQFSNLIRASPLRLPDSLRTRDTPPDGIFNPRKKLAFIRVSNWKNEFLFVTLDTLTISWSEHCQGIPLTLTQESSSTISWPHALDGFYCRWLENSVIDTGKAATIPLMFNHLKWNHS